MHIRRPDPLGSRPRRAPAAIALSCAVALLVTAAWSTSAAHATGGTIESSWVTNCNGDPETGIMAGIESIDDPLPRVGDVFYVRTLPARVGNACGAHMSVHVEIVLPEGVSLAISPATPVRCAYDDGSGLTEFTDGCPQTGTPGMFGPAFDRATPDGPAAWEMPPGRMHVIWVPLRSSRKLVGSASMLPSCNRVYGSPPCPAALAGDHVQFAIKVVDGFGAPWLVPYAPLFVAPAAGTPTAPGAGTPAAPGTVTSPAAPGTVTPSTPAPSTAQAVIASAPQTIRVARLRRGVPIAVRVRQPRSRITARLTLRGKTVAQATMRAAQPGTRTLRLRSTATGRTALRRLRASTAAVLHVTVTPPSGSAATVRRQVKLRP